MFFLKGMMVDSNALDTTANKTLIDTINISNGIFDHLNLLSVINLATNVFDTTIPQQWTTNTLLNPNFNGTINGGNVSEFIGSIDHLEIQRKEIGSNEWITLQTISKNFATGEINPSFTFEDTYAKDQTLYTYQVVPVDANGNQGIALQKDVLSKFDNAYIADASHIYNITPEYKLTKQTNQISTTYTPYGSKYPFVAFNAETKYDSGSVTAILLAPTSQNTTISYLDRVAQTNLVKEFNDWLSNGRPKILKDFNGLYKIVICTNAVSNNYYKELGNGLASTSFNIVEIGEFTQEYLQKLGMINKFPIKYKT